MFRKELTVDDFETYFGFGSEHNKLIFGNIENEKQWMDFPFTKWVQIFLHGLETEQISKHKFDLNMETGLKLRWLCGTTNFTLSVITDMFYSWFCMDF